MSRMDPVEIAVSFVSILIGLFIAIYLYVLEKRRDEYQIKQTEAFNKWMKEQTQRQMAMMEALQKSLPEAQSKELTRKVTALLPGSVQIGEIVINRANIRIFQSFIGGGIYLEAVAFDDEGEELRTQFEKLREGQTLKIISPDHTGLVQIKTINVETSKADDTMLYTFSIMLQIKG